MTDAQLETESEHQLCQSLVDGVVGVGEDADGNEQLDIVEDGHKCPNDAVEKVEMNTHSGLTMEMWLCEDHLDHYRESGAIVEEVEDR